MTFSLSMRAPAATTSNATCREDWKLTDASGATVPVGGSNTIWASIVVPGTGPVNCTAATDRKSVVKERVSVSAVDASLKKITKTWTLKNNSSTCTWSTGFSFRYVSNTNGVLSPAQGTI